MGLKQTFKNNFQIRDEIEHERGTLQLVNTSLCTTNVLGNYRSVHMENVRQKAIDLRNATFTAQIREGSTTSFARLFPPRKNFIPEHLIKVRWHILFVK